MTAAAHLGATKAETDMHTGKGLLVLRNGRRLPIAYQLGGNGDHTQAGYLICDTSDVDPAALWDGMQLLCDDGTELTVAVTHSGDRYLAVAGRVAEAAA